ncbi:MAG: hypothetical protein JWQ87_2286 [Candidatus Sulfotelmatobacter sp.]|nr:hypothetical protein [Candidatus Sulfotelmatobacter sp.]
MPPKLLSEYDKSAVASAGAVFKQISTVHERQYSYEPPPNTILYHYTSAEGLKGIIESNELWSTSAYYLNDSAEMFYGYDVLKEVLDQWLSNNSRSEDSITLGLARQLRSSFQDLFEKRLLKPVYLTCFCEEDNLLSQWRAYGQSGGYSIGFRVLPKVGVFGERLVPEPNIYTCRWTRVEYERTKQAEICRNILDPIFAMLDEPTMTQAMRAVSEHPFLGYQKLFTETMDVLLEEIVRFKSEAFKVEKEWRAVVRQRESSKQGTDDGGKTPVPVHFRTSRGTLVPYVKLLPWKQDKKLPIAAIRSGPMLDSTMATVAITMMLDRNRFPFVRVQGSDISVRF